MERGGCSDNWNVVEVQSRYRPVLCNAVAHTTCTILLPHRVYSMWQHDGTVWVATWLCFGMVWHQMVYNGWVNMMVYSYSICELWYGRVWVGQDDGMGERSLWQHHKQLSTQGRLLNDGHN